MQEPVHKMMRFFDEGKIDSAEAKSALHEMLLERMSGVKKVFPQLLKSLDEINAEAVRHGVDVGLD